MKILFAVMMVILISPAFSAASTTVTIVQSSEAKPYQEAVTSLEKELKNLGYQNKSQIINLKSIIQNKEQLLSIDKRAIFVAVGTKAAIYMSKSLPPEATLTYCMVAKVENLKRSNAIRGSGVSTDIPIDAQIQIIRESIPKIYRIGMLYRSDDTKSQNNMMKVQKVLPRNWELNAVNVVSYQSISEAIKSLCRQKIDLILTQ